MRIARILLVLSLLASAGLLAAHFLNLPGYPIGGWVAASRVEKVATFGVSGDPFTSDSWPSRWGRNRPAENRPHELLSEIEVTVQHHLRAEGILSVSVTGDSEAEVDSFIEMLRHEFDRVYTGHERADDIFAAKHGALYDIFDPLEDTWYWRQRYLWLLIANVVVVIALLMALRTGLKRRAEAVANAA